MPRVESHDPGTPCWIDLATTDPATARAFYTEVFGWRAEDAPMPSGDGAYTLLYQGDAMVGALYEIAGPMKEAGVPSHWKSYFAVEDVDASAEKVAALGGSIDAPPFDVPGVARMSAVRDSEGATFVLYRAQGEVGLQLVNEPGAYCWSELYSREPSRASEFYGGLFGWITDESPGSDGNPYYELGPSGRHVAGMMKIRPEWGPVPPSWTIYFQVADVEASLEAVKAHAGAVVMPVMNVPEVGRFAMVTDPTGARFMVMQMNERASE